MAIPSSFPLPSKIILFVWAPSFFSFATPSPILVHHLISYRLLLINQDQRKSLFTVQPHGTSGDGMAQSYCMGEGHQDRHLSLQGGGGGPQK